MTRESLIDFITSEYGYAMNQMSSTDAILYCRGPALDSSSDYNEDKLISWLQSSMPAMRKIEKPFSLNGRKMPNSVNTSQDKIYVSKMGGGGFMGSQSVKNGNLYNMQMGSGEQGSINPALIKEMDACFV